MSMRNRSLIFIVLFLSHHTSAQDRVFEILPKMLENRNVEMTYEKSRPGSYSVANPGNEIKLKRVLGLTTLILLVAGNIIGTGVFKKIVPMAAAGLSENYILGTISF